MVDDARFYYKELDGHTYLRYEFGMVKIFVFFDMLKCEPTK